jgi:uncharacterized membrane protein YkvA (DUF1232 family)
VNWLQKAKMWARSIKRDVVALWLAARDARVPWYAKLMAGCVAAYALSPIDLIPDFIPVLGYLDDILLVPLGIMLAVRMIPACVMQDLRMKAAAKEGKPISVLAASVIVLLWIAGAALLAWIPVRSGLVFGWRCRLGRTERHDVVGAPGSIASYAGDMIYLPPMHGLLDQRHGDGNRHPSGLEADLVFGLVGGLLQGNRSKMSRLPVGVGHDGIEAEGRELRHADPASHLPREIVRQVGSEIVDLDAVEITAVEGAHQVRGRGELLPERRNERRHPKS